MNVVGGYPKTEAIVMEKQKGKEVDDYVHRFPKLRALTVTYLRKLKSFCKHRSRRYEAQVPLFDHQVAFPALEKLHISDLPKIADILDKKIRPDHQPFCPLGILNVGNCVVSPHVLRRLRFVDLLIARSCRGAREVFDFDGVEVGDGQERVGPSVVNATSVAKALGGLKVLYLSSCSTMEAVIATDEEHLDDGDEIEFPKLEWLILKDLSHLKSFCISNHNFNLPSLKRVVLKRCPKMQAFTSGSVRMPQILLSTRGNECLTIEDLNKHLEQQHLKGDQENIVADEMYGDEEQFSLLFAFWSLLTIVVVGAASVKKHLWRRSGLEYAGFPPMTKICKLDNITSVNDIEGKVADKGSSGFMLNDKGVYCGLEPSEVASGWQLVVDACCWCW
ncbi:hypothetical protein Vadar_022830 [Vaccinium darrowii]|uniref:Uncharacterized protein n=1 Tax=Vaccinium darrowii TaxID=229202 RepID=A0ACB7YFM9_9ERIC|nr:hypothetical protein Vadar_022830 [Vaccinium darrowii]